MSDEFDVVVIGGGTAGLVTASGCARLGRKVAMISRDPLGGDCLWTGCVPTKALVATSKLIGGMHHASRFGLGDYRPHIDSARIMESMRAARRKIEPHDDPEKFRALGIDVILEAAELESPTRVRTASGRALEAKQIVLATGSRTFVPPIEGIDAAGWMDHASFLEQDEFPRRIAILGAGAIGTEFAQLFARFGSSVTLIQQSARILDREDSEVAARVRAILEADGVTIRTGTTAVRAGTDGSGKWIDLEGEGAGRLSVDEIFVATGRRGNIEGLGLENAGVKTSRTWIAADEYLRTSVDGIWACGDIKGPPQFTHAAAHEAVGLVRNLLFPLKSKIDYTHMPWGVYTDPEVGHIGMTEEEARAGGGDVRVYRVEMDQADRAVAERHTAGFIKIIADGKGRILGAHAVCEHATTVIQEIVLARKHGLKVKDLAGRVSSYPSMADAVQKAATQYYQALSSSWLGTVAKKVASWSS
ncbi:MAG: FAD-dependent oxidoreductase [Acidobacteria bacterium]|nr:FAD-dependent oxidoreductase [Acidobacteriota bacterium]